MFETICPTSLWLKAEVIIVWKRPLLKLSNCICEDEVISIVTKMQELEGGKMSMLGNRKKASKF